MCDAKIGRFKDGEVEVDIRESVRGQDVFLIQPTCPPVNENLVELLVLLDALKRASARRINLVMPYYGYARQDRKVVPRAPISAKLVADMIQVAGGNKLERLVASELHAGQIQGFFNIPVDHLYTKDVFLDHFSQFDGKRLVVISPDAGGIDRARAYAQRLHNADIAIVDKRREEANESKIMHIVGDVKDKIAIIIDDMIDTAGTTVQVAEAAEKYGALEIYAACTHALLSDNAVERINNSPIKELIVANTIPLGEKENALQRLRVLDTSHIFGDAIEKIHVEKSVSALF
jgi:ribose-phosphate pyrophosphokinase